MMQPEFPAGHERQELVDVLTSARGHVLEGSCEMRTDVLYLCLFYAPYE